MYMKRQMIPAPTNEIAIGRKMRLLANDSRLVRSAITAASRPSAVDRNVTATTHHRLFMTVPRRLANTAKLSSRAPPSPIPTVPAEKSARTPRRRPRYIAITAMKANSTTAP